VYGPFFDELCLLMIGEYGRVCPTLKNVTCFDRWAKAHPTLLWSFGMQRTAGIKYGVPGIPEKCIIWLENCVFWQYQ
jgi:hypothetical protein